MRVGQEMDLDLRRSRVQQTIDLGELLAADFTGNRGLRLAIAQRVLDHIADRTADGIDVDGNAFAPYSSEYTESAEFILSGKSAGQVNMELTGNMLASMDVLGEGPNTITIGIADPEQAPKAYNHNVGDTLPRRAFFGIKHEDLVELIEDEFGEDLASLRQTPEDQSTIRDIFSEGAFRRALQGAGALSESTDQRVFFATIGEIIGSTD